LRVHHGRLQITHEFVVGTQESKCQLLSITQIKEIITCCSCTGVSVLV
jgi:hypothetical protein